MQASSAAGSSVYSQIMPRIRRYHRPFVRVLTILGILGFTAFAIVAFLPNPESCNCKKDEKAGVELGVRGETGAATEDKRNVYGSKHKLAIVVPFRDRYAELLEFAPHIHRYLKDKDVDHAIYVVNQIDDLRFNRASLINIGYLLSRADCDYIAMHDVDLLPLNPVLNYSYPRDFLYHVASPELHPRYNYAMFIGGILLVNNNHFKLVNGMSNKFYGWGKEDDEFYVRILEMNLTVARPQHITTGRRTFRHIHNKKERPRDQKRYGNQWTVTSQRDRETGADNVDFELKYMKELVIDGAPVTLVGVELNCDIELTSWCIHPEQLESFNDQRAIQGLNPPNRKLTEEEKRLEAVKSSVLQYQEHITEFRRQLKPLRTVAAEELPKWMQRSATAR